MSLPTIPEYSNSIKTPALVLPKVLQGGYPLEKGQRLIKYAGGFCVVFPFQTASKKYAVRCWHAEVADAKKRTQLIADAIHDSALQYFVGFKYYQDGIMTPSGVQPLVVMDWVDAKPLKKFIKEYLNNPCILNELAQNFLLMVKNMHTHQFSHGDLQHGNVMVRPDKSIVLVDYDSMYVPALQNYEDEIKGLVGYQHPARWNNKYASPKADYFSELVIFLSIKSLAKYPSLWDELQMEDTETLLFDADDIQSKGKSEIFNKLKRDKDLHHLVETLIDFLQKNTIEDLDPLENVVISKADNIANKWKYGNGHKDSLKKQLNNEANAIGEKWKNGNGFDELQKKAKENLMQNISSKFKLSE
jgi:serine/threonine protein kinase